MANTPVSPLTEICILYIDGHVDIQTHRQMDGTYGWADRQADSSVSLKTFFFQRHNYVIGRHFLS